MATIVAVAGLSRPLSPGVGGAVGHIPRLHHLPRTRALRLRLHFTTSGHTLSPLPRAVGRVDGSHTVADKPVVPDTEISVTKTSFGSIGLTLGTSLLTYGFGAYFTILPGAEWSAIMLTYGFPLAIIGMALKYAELKPVPCITYADAYALRQSQATPILTQVRSDVTRYRYGDEQHLEEALKRIFRYGQAGGIQRRNAPKLQSIREEVTEQGKYTLVLVFQAPALKMEDFVSRQAKFAAFFGPGVESEIATAGDNTYEVLLVAAGS